MLTDRGTPPSGAGGRSPWRNPLVYSSAVLVLVGLYVGWVVLTRWHENRQLEHRALDARLEKQREQDRATIEQLGGKDLQILMFYASPGTIEPDQTAQLCYGVANAKSVTLEPQSSPVWPSPNRCVEVAPRKTTTYVLTITDSAGHTQTQSLQIKVR